jgi:hypothetical protein
MYREVVGWVTLRDSLWVHLHNGQTSFSVTRFPIFDPSAYTAPRRELEKHDLALLLLNEQQQQ